MNVAFWMTLVGGLAMAVTFVALGLWQILSAPDRPNYPTSGPVKRALMFWLMVVMAGRSVEVLGGLMSADPQYLTEWQASAALFMAALFVVFLIDHLQHWLPARTHERIRQLRKIANCRPSQGLKNARRSASLGNRVPPADIVGPALVELRLEGVEVAGPNAGPEVFADR